MKCIIPLFLFFALTPAYADQEVTKPSLLQTANGRFVFGQIGPARADQYMLDTKTGRLWQRVVDKDGVSKLQSVPYISGFMGEDQSMPASEHEEETQNKMIRSSAIETLRKTLEKQSNSTENKEAPSNPTASGSKPKQN